jgi:NAD(P)-dependent dehydrogenase (short-subunit alcohol dehydrogenase family)
MNTGFQRKHVVVTGASSGIGFDTISILLAEGAKVTAGYHRDPKNIKTLTNSYPDRLNVVNVDVRHESEVAFLFTEAHNVFGRVDVAVANAGIVFHEEVPTHKMPIEQWQKTIAVNLTGVFLCAKHFFANLKKYPGNTASLVLVGSTAGDIGEAGHCDYATSKAGLRGLLMTLKNEIVDLAARGRVNLVNPGWTTTPMTEEKLSDKATMSRILQTIPLRKVAAPSDISHAILYLASDELAGHVSGQTITVAGGMDGRVLFSRDEVEASMT